jgi:hypothetical protein
MEKNVKIFLVLLVCVAAFLAVGYVLEIVSQTEALRLFKKVGLVLVIISLSGLVISLIAKTKS